METLKIILLLSAILIQCILLFRLKKRLNKSLETSKSLSKALEESQEMLKKWRLITTLYASRNIISEEDELIYKVKVSHQL